SDRRGPPCSPPRPAGRRKPGRRGGGRRPWGSARRPWRGSSGGCRGAGRRSGRRRRTARRNRPGGRKAARPSPAPWARGTAGASASKGRRKPTGRVRPLPGVYQKAAGPSPGEMPGRVAPLVLPDVPRRLARPLFVFWLACGPALPLLAQEKPLARSPAAFFRSIRAARRASPVSIDGRVDEPAWKDAELGEGFTQFEPDEGQKPTAP